MHLTDLFEAYRHRKLTLRSDPETPGALRLIDSNSRELIALVRSPAEFINKMKSHRLIPALDFVIVIPPQVYTQNQTVIDNIVQVSRYLDRPVKFELAGGQPLG